MSPCALGLIRRPALDRPANRCTPRALWAAAAIAAALTLVACSGKPSASVRDLNLPAQGLTVPAAEYYGIAWADASTLALLSSAAGSVAQPITAVPIDRSPGAVRELPAVQCQIRNLAGFSTR